MSPEAQRIAIAEACGWISCRQRHTQYASVIDGINPHGGAEIVPDYLNDLNAMHEAEEVTRRNQFHAVNYPHEVFKVVTGLEWKGDMGYFFPMVIHATAAQRAEAFLRTIGKWIESPHPAPILEGEK